MMPAVEFADFGFGTVVGAVVAGSIAIFLDQRRRNDEKKNRFQDRKQRTYKDFLTFSDVLLSEISLHTTFRLTVKRFEREDIVNQAAADELTEILEEASKTDLDQLEEHFLSAATELGLLAPDSVGRAGYNMWQIAKRMIQRLSDGEDEKAAALEREYGSARREFTLAARRDLGTDA
jgi:exonuclease VII large subunit